MLLLSTLLIGCDEPEPTPSPSRLPQSRSPSRQRASRCWQRSSHRGSSPSPVCSRAERSSAARTVYRTSPTSRPASETPRGCPQSRSREAAPDDTGDTPGCCRAPGCRGQESRWKRRRSARRSLCCHQTAAGRRPLHVGRRVGLQELTQRHCPLSASWAGAEVAEREPTPPGHRVARHPPATPPALSASRASPAAASQPRAATRSPVRSPGSTR
ncbi:MAG: hypothetical protein ACI8RZ_003515 [Myxococcota bacterium]|jgi:hypothetical protein